MTNDDTPDKRRNRKYEKYTKLSEVPADTSKEAEVMAAVSSDALLDALRKHHPNYHLTHHDVITRKK